MRVVGMGAFEVGAESCERHETTGCRNEDLQEARNGAELPHGGPRECAGRQPHGHADDATPLRRGRDGAVSDAIANRGPKERAQRASSARQGGEEVPERRVVDMALDQHVGRSGNLRRSD